MDDNVERFDITQSEDELRKTFEQWLKESRTYHDTLMKAQKVAHEYYIGNQTAKDFVANGNTDTVENRIFEAVETIVPITTSKAHQFVVLPGSENEKSMQRAANLQKILSRKYETLEMQKKLEHVTRHLLIYRFGVLKPEWNWQTDDVDVRVIDPRMILVPKMNLDPHELPYKIEIQDYTRKELEDYFPDYKKVGELTPEAEIDIGRVDFDKKLYRVYEVWTNEMVAWFCNKKLLEKRANPYFDFKGEERPYVEQKKRGKGAKIGKRLVFSNILDRPIDPYVFFTTYVVGQEPLGSTSLVEVVMPIQDAINTQKRRIIDNLRRMGNGQVYIDTDAMSEEEAANITDEVGLIIRGEGIASQNKIRREPGTQLPIAHFNNLTHSESVFDNIMGVHGATRGNAGGKTLGQDIISRQQDFTRIDLITRVLNRGVSRVALLLVQMMKMYYDETKVVKIIGEEGAIEFVRLNRDDIEDYIEIIVKSGETLPMDKVSLRTEALQLWQLGGLDPVTLFERLEFPNPAKAAERLVAWKQGQLTAETQSQIQQIAAQAAFAPAPTPGAGGATPSAPAKSGESGREIETPMNVVQRATAGVGGSANLTATPKQ